MDPIIAKLRELTLTYTVPQTLFGGKIFKQATVSIVGRNLLLFYPNKYKNFYGCNLTIDESEDQYSNMNLELVKIFFATVLNAKLVKNEDGKRADLPNSHYYKDENNFFISVFSLSKESSHSTKFVSCLAL